MNRTIYNTNFVDYLPEALKDDERIVGIAEALTEKMLDISGLMKCVLIYTRIDELPEEILDILAYDMHVDWYEDKYPIEIKRDIIKNSVKVHKRMGTKYAVEKAIKSIYPNSKVEEWFEYGGEPHKFRIICNTTNSKVGLDYREIVQAVQIYKRLSAHLEEIMFKKDNYLKLNAALAMEAVIEVTLGGDMNGIGNVKANAALAAEATIDIVLGRGE